MKAGKKRMADLLRQMPKDTDWRKDGFAASMRRVNENKAQRSLIAQLLRATVEEEMAA